MASELKELFAQASEIVKGLGGHGLRDCPSCGFNRPGVNDAAVEGGWRCLFCEALGRAYGCELLGRENAEDDARAMRARAEKAEAEVAAYKADLEAAAGELLVPLPEPHSVQARLLSANSLMRQERDRALARVRELEAQARGGVADKGPAFVPMARHQARTDMLARERDRLAADLEREKAAHARTQGWLDRFQGEYSAACVRAWRLEKTLSWLDTYGGLEGDAHDRCRAALAGEGASAKAVVLNAGAEAARGPVLAPGAAERLWAALTAVADLGVSDRALRTAEATVRELRKLAQGALAAELRASCEATLGPLEAAADKAAADARALLGETDATDARTQGWLDRFQGDASALALRVASLEEAARYAEDKLRHAAGECRNAGPLGRIAWAIGRALRALEDVRLPAEASNRARVKAAADEVRARYAGAFAALAPNDGGDPAPPAEHGGDEPIGFEACWALAPEAAGLRDDDNAHRCRMPKGHEGDHVATNGRPFPRGDGGGA